MKVVRVVSIFTLINMKAYKMTDIVVYLFIYLSPPLRITMPNNPAVRKDKQADGDSVSHLICFFHGGMSSLVSTLPTLVVFPIYKTIFRQQIYNSTMRQAMGQLQTEGLRKLYRGVLPPLFQRTLNGTVLFGVYENFHRRLTLSSQTVLPSSALPTAAGLGTGVVEALALTPLERVQNLLQNNENDKKLPRLRNVLAELRTRSLASGVYRGFLPTVVRNALGSAIYFGLKGPIYDTVHGQGLPPLFASFSSGMMSSWPITVIVYPMSALVANMQKDLGGEAKGAVACWRMLWKERNRSVRQLYRGVPLGILRSCISWGVTTALYDWQRLN